MTKKKTQTKFWAILHIPSSSIIGLVTLSQEFTLFEKKEDVKWVLYDCILDYRKYCIDSPDYYSSSLLNILTQTVSTVEFDVIEVTVPYESEQRHAGVFPGICPSDEDFYLGFMEAKQSIY